MWKRRSAVEPIIGHMKSDNLLNRNELSGKDGDRSNVILSACGFNIRKLLEALSFAKNVYEFLATKFFKSYNVQNAYICGR